MDSAGPVHGWAESVLMVNRREVLHLYRMHPLSNGGGYLADDDFVDLRTDTPPHVIGAQVLILWDGSLELVDPPASWGAKTKRFFANEGVQSMRDLARGCTLEVQIERWPTHIRVYPMITDWDEGTIALQADHSVELERGASPVELGEAALEGLALARAISTLRRDRRH